MATLAEIKQQHLLAAKVSGSSAAINAAQKAAIDKNGKNYKIGSNASDNLFTDKNGKVLKQNNVIKFTPAFFGHTNATGSWQVFPSASAGRTEGDGEIVLVHDTFNWNFKFDAAKHKNFISASFIEFVEDGPE